MKFRFPLLLLGALVGAMVVLSIVVAAIGPTSRTSPTSPTSASLIAETVTSNLGTREYVYGSDWQGVELLRLYTTNPTTSRFVISANDGRGERVELIADRTTDTLERRHWHAEGRGQREVWKGSLRERLQGAAKGDGFNYGSGSGRLPVVNPI